MVLLYYSFTVKLQGSLGVPLPQRSQPDGLGVQKQAEGGQGGVPPLDVYLKPPLVAEKLLRAWSLYHYSIITPYQYIIMSLCHYVIMSLYRYVIISLAIILYGGLSPPPVVGRARLAAGLVGFSASQNNFQTQHLINHDQPTIIHWPSVLPNHSLTSSDDNSRNHSLTNHSLTIIHWPPLLTNHSLTNHALTMIS